MRILLLLLVIGTVGSIKINAVDGIPLDWLRAPQPGTPAARADAFPTPVPLRPLSMRTIYRTSSPVVEPSDADRLLILEGNALAGASVKVKLIGPRATSCGDPVWTLPIPGRTILHEFSNTNADGTLPFSPANRGQLRAQFKFPLKYGQTSFDQNYGTTTNPINRLELPHEHLWPWICVCSGTDDADCSKNWIHTNLRYAPVFRCDGDSSTTNFATDHNVNIPSDFCQISQGLVTGTTYNGNERSQAISDFGELQFPSSPPSVNQLNIAGTTQANPIFAGEVRQGNHLWLERRQKTVCCGFNQPNTAGVTTKRYGVCINPKIEGCCQRTASLGLGKPYSHFREKCCYGGAWPTNSDRSTDLTPIESQVPPEPIIISYLDDWCPCLSTRVNEFCNQNLPFNGATNNCCVKTKYPELVDSAAWGKCYDGFREKCCDTGDIYDPGVNQCCQINGVQSVNVPCPCSRDTHCGVNQTCCQDLSKRAMFPLPQEDNTLCSPYVNYPTGSGAYQVQPCIGQCIDTRFQICCNGMACQEAFEDCCNNTCCNKFVQRCTIGLRLGAAGKFNNPKDFRVPYEVCTTIEAMTPIRATLMYFGPLILLLATFLGLAFTLFFAKRQNSLQPLSAYEKSMFALACGVILFSWPLYFSALFKYGLALIWTAFFTILAALSQIRGLNIAAVVANGVLLIYLIDPFFGSEIFNLAFSRAPPRSNSVHAYSGVLSSILMLYDNDQVDCQSFYDYFKRDPATEDRLRWDNPHKMSFGFCSRDWFTALGIFEAIALMLVFILFFVSLITHIRNILFGKAEKTEEVVGWY